ncbi:MAG: iron-sulfur cluster assembly scaffold protein, partial [Pseudomonadota bacterium]
CGSTVTVDVDMADGRVADLGMDVKACALGQASASVLASAAPGKTPEEVAAARDALQRLLKEGAADLDALGPDFAALEAMTPARDFKNRHASILLAWDAALEAMDGAAARRLRRS